MPESTNFEVCQVAVKLYVEDPSAVVLDDYIPVFHSWIRDKKITDHLLIDVADYRHVPEGPGVMLIAHQAHYSMDMGAPGPGLLVSHKRDAPLPARQAFSEALQRAGRVASLLQSESVAPRFRTTDLELRVMSRLHAPNNVETSQCLEPIWTEVLESKGFEGVQLTPESDPRSAFSLRLSSCARAPGLADLG